MRQRRRLASVTAMLRTSNSGSRMRSRRAAGSVMVSAAYTTEARGSGRIATIKPSRRCRGADRRRPGVGRRRRGRARRRCWCRRAGCRRLRLRWTAPRRSGGRAHLLPAQSRRSTAPCCSTSAAAVVVSTTSVPSAPSRHRRSLSWASASAACTAAADGLHEGDVDAVDGVVPDGELAAQRLRRRSRQCPAPTQGPPSNSATGPGSGISSGDTSRSTLSRSSRRSLGWLNKHEVAAAVDPGEVDDGVAAADEIVVGRR